MHAQLQVNDLEDPDGPDVGTDRFERVGTHMAQLVAAGVPSVELAAVVVAVLRDVDAALKPIVGERGVAALYRRTLHVARQAHAWLPPVSQARCMAAELNVLATGLAQQPAMAAACAGRDLLQAFADLLTSLIGSSLTERLLCPVWANLSSGPSAQGTMS